MPRFMGEIEVRFDDKSELKAFLNSLKPEISSYSGYRSKVYLKVGEDLSSLYIVVESSDVASFRASMNSFLRILGPLFTLARKEIYSSTDG